MPPDSKSPIFSLKHRCIHIYSPVCICTLTQRALYFSSNAQIYMYLYTNICVYIWIYAYVYLFIHIHIYEYTTMIQSVQPSYKFAHWIKKSYFFLKKAYWVKEFYLGLKHLIWVYNALIGIETPIDWKSLISVCASLYTRHRANHGRLIVYVSIFLSVYLSICLSVCLSVCLFVSLSVCVVAINTLYLVCHFKHFVLMFSSSQHCGTRGCFWVRLIRFLLGLFSPWSHRCLVREIDSVLPCFVLFHRALHSVLFYFTGLFCSDVGRFFTSCPGMFWQECRAFPQQYWALFQ